MPVIDFKFELKDFKGKKLVRRESPTFTDEGKVRIEDGEPVMKVEYYPPLGDIVLEVLNHQGVNEAGNGPEVFSEEQKRTNFKLMHRVGFCEGPISLEPKEIASIIERGYKCYTGVLIGGLIEQALSEDAVIPKDLNSPEEIHKSLDNKKKKKRRDK